METDTGIQHLFSAGVYILLVTNIYQIRPFTPATNKISKYWRHARGRYKIIYTEQIRLDDVSFGVQNDIFISKPNKHPIR